MINLETHILLAGLMDYCCESLAGSSNTLVVWEKRSDFEPASYSARSLSLSANSSRVCLEEISSGCGMEKPHLDVKSYMPQHLAPGW